MGSTSEKKRTLVPPMGTSTFWYWIRTVAATTVAVTMWVAVSPVAVVFGRQFLAASAAEQQFYALTIGAVFIIGIRGFRATRNRPIRGIAAQSLAPTNAETPV